MINTKQGVQNKKEIHNKQNNIYEADEILKENLKLIVTLIVDEVWRNYENYTLQKKVLE